MSVNLQKLTVPQLKALCREKGLTGYSKLPKLALIEKLAATKASTPLLASSETITRLEPLDRNAPEKKQPKVPRALVQPAAQDSGLGHPPAVSSEPAVSRQTLVDNVGETLPSAATNTKATQQVPSLARPYQQRTSPENPILIRQQSPTPKNIINGTGPVLSSRNAANKPLLRPTSPSGGGEPPSKRQKSDHNQDQRLLQMTASELQTPVTIQGHISPTIQSADNDKSQVIKRMPRETAGTGKRYIPLITKFKDTSTSDVVQGRRQAELANNYHSAPSASLSQSFVEAALDFNDGLFAIPVTSVEQGLSFKAITLPPSLSQRKFATKLAIILRDVEAADMSSLTVTSRLFRYSAYLSAASHLKRWYAGERLDTVLSMEGVSVDRVSLWQYRKLREKEVEERKCILSRSMEISGSGQLLGKLLDWDMGVVEGSVWRRDNVNGLVVALR